MEFFHKPIMLDECIDGLNIKSDGIYVDGTLGGAGHSKHIAAKLESGKLVGIDRDEIALAAAGEVLKEYGEKVVLRHGNFKDMSDVLNGLGINGINGLLLDLGVSSPQLDDAERGFSYMEDAALDMRMDKTQKLTAEEVVNTWDKDVLAQILFDYGEERYARAIAGAIVRRREAQPIKTTLELVDIIKSAMPAEAKREKQHPAKRSFQAIRIAVNRELDSLEEALSKISDILLPGGRVCIISFHSLEDRMVKRYFQEAAKGCTCPRDFPVCVCGKKPQMKIITKKPLTASEEELEYNPRARSAKLRIAEKI